MFCVPNSSHALEDGMISAPRLSTSKGRRRSISGSSTAEASRNFLRRVLQSKMDAPMPGYLCSPGLTEASDASGARSGCPGSSKVKVIAPRSLSAARGRPSCTPMGLRCCLQQPGLIAFRGGQFPRPKRLMQPLRPAMTERPTVTVADWRIRALMSAVSRV